MYSVCQVCHSHLGQPVQTFDLRMMRYVNKLKKKSVDSTPEVVKLWGTASGRVLPFCFPAYLELKMGDVVKSFGLIYGYSPLLLNQLD